MLVIFVGEGVMSQVQGLPGSWEKGPRLLSPRSPVSAGLQGDDQLLLPVLACPGRAARGAQAFPDTPVCLDLPQCSGDGRHQEKGAWTT